VGRQHVSIYLSTSLFVIALYFIIRLVWTLTKTSLARPRLLLARTLLSLALLGFLYFGGHAGLKGYIDFTATDLANPWLAVYYIIYKSSFLITLVWMVYYFSKIAISSRDSGFRIRAWLGVSGASCGCVHHTGGIITHLLGVARLVSIADFPLTYRITNSFLTVSIALIGIALAAPPDWFRLVTGLQEKFSLLKYYHGIARLATMMASVWPEAAKYNQHSDSLLDRLNPLRVGTRLHRRVILISDGIRFLGRYLSEDEYLRMLRVEPNTSAHCSEVSTPAIVLAKVLLVALERHNANVRVHPLAPPLSFKVPEASYHDLLDYLIEVSQKVESLGLNDITLPA